LANGTFRGHIIAAARAGRITECAANIVTAGAAGALGRFVIYRMDGKVLAHSADFDATTTGLKSRVLPTPARVGKNEQVIVGGLHSGPTGVSAVYNGTGTVHDSRIALNTAASYFSATRSSYALSGVPVPAVDQAFGFITAPEGSTVSSSDSAPLVAVKVGPLYVDWDITAGPELHGRPRHLTGPSKYPVLRGALCRAPFRAAPAKHRPTLRSVPTQPRSTLAFRRS
jgi:hypothetical protein